MNRCGEGTSCRNYARTFPLSVLLVVMCSNLLLAQNSPSVNHAGSPVELWGNLDRGSFDVGFRCKFTLDSTRKSASFPIGRPLQISVWYPAERSSSPARMKYKDYFVLSAVERSAKTASDSEDASSIAEYKQIVLSAGVEGNAVDAWMNGLMAGQQDAAWASGTFPLVLIAQGNFHSAHHQAILAEYLASHGYVVATVPSQTRISGPIARVEDALASAEEQIDDLKFLLNSVSKHSQVDSRRLALIGHSFGGRSTLLATARGLRVAALLSLDGGAGLKGALGMIHQASYFMPADMRIPFLHCYQNSDSSIVSDLSLVQSMKNSDRFVVRFGGTNHFFFTSMGMAAGTIPGFNGLTGTKSRQKYEALCRYSLFFLKMFVEHDTSVAKVLENPPAQSGLASEDIVVEHYRPVAYQK